VGLDLPAKELSYLDTPTTLTNIFDVVTTYPFIQDPLSQEHELFTVISFIKLGFA